MAEMASTTMALTYVEHDEQGVVVGIRVELDLDPALIRKNLRYRNTHHPPKVVQDATKKITEDMHDACTQAGWTSGTEYVRVDFEFTLDSRKQDADGPLWRALDAIKGQDGCGFDDNRVQFITIRRRIGPPKMVVQLSRFPADPGEILPRNWRGDEPVLEW
jgi:hypothetical protein